jgi:hypothetical protein
MSNKYTINLTNNSPNTQDFFFFQKPAIYTGGRQIYANSIYQTALRGKDSGAVFTFNLLQQYYAGVQDQVQNLVVGEASGFTTVYKEISLTPASGNPTLNGVTMELNPLGLTNPASTPDVEPGAFRIITPEFNPVTNKYNIGLAIKNESDGSIVLSNFINAEPAKNIDVQPVLEFYLQTGSYQAGSVVNFTTSSIGAAICDTTQGITTFNVEYNANGSWTVNDQPQNGSPQLIALV